MDLSFLCIFKDNNHRSCNIISYEKFNDILLIRIYIYPKFDHKKKWLFTLLLLFLQYYIFILVRCWSLQVWNACKSSTDDSEQPYHELDVLAGHENDVNYVQFRFVKLHISLVRTSVKLYVLLYFPVLECSGCAVAPRFSPSDALKEDALPRFKNAWWVGCHPILYFLCVTDLLHVLFFFIWRLPQR